MKSVWDRAAIRIIFNNTLVDIKIKSADVLLKMLIILSELRIATQGKAKLL